MEDSILPKVTKDLPMLSGHKVEHLSDLEFADPDYGTPAHVDILLEGKVFSKAVLHERWFVPSGTLSAFETLLLGAER